MKKIIMLILITLNLYAISDFEKKMYLKMFGSIPTKTTKVSLYINNYFIKNDLKIESVQLEHNYIYGLDVLNNFLKKPIVFKEKTNEKDIPFKYDLDYEKERFYLQIDPELLKPFELKLNGEKTLVPDTKVNTWYYNIPLYVNYINEEYQYSYSFNFFYKDFYLKKSIDKEVLGYKNFEIGDTSSSFYGGIQNKQLKEGFSFRSDNNKNYKTDSDFSNVYIEDNSIVEFYKNGMLLETRTLSKGYWNLTNYNKNSDYRIKILNLKTNETTIIESNRVMDNVFNWDIAFNKKVVSGGFVKGFRHEGIYLKTELGFTYSKDFKEFGSRIKIDDLTLEASLTKNKSNNLTVKEKQISINYKNVKLEYKDKKENILNFYNDTIHERNGKYISLNYKIDKLYLTLEKNLETKKYGYKIKYNNKYKEINYDFEYKKDEKQDYLGFKVSVPLYKTKNTKITLNNRYAKSDYNNEEINYDLDINIDNTYGLDTDINIKHDNDSNKNTFNGSINKPNQYINNSIRHKDKKVSGFISTNIIGSKNGLGLSKNKPLTDSSVYFLDNGTPLNDIIHVPSKHKKFSLNQLDFEIGEDYKKTDFVLEYKKNMSGVIELNRIRNLSFTPEFKIKPFTSFIYYKESNPENIKINFISNDNELFLEEAATGVYVFEFEGKKEKVLITEKMFQEYINRFKQLD